MLQLIEILRGYVKWFVSLWEDRENEQTNKQKNTLRLIV